MKNIRSRYFGFILYPDDVNFVDRMKVISEYEYIMMLHDRDFTEDGEPKKPHYHCVVQFTDAKTISSVAKRFNLSENQIQVFTKEKGKTLDGYLVYMTHANEPDKALYDVSDFLGCPELINRAKKAIKEKVTKLSSDEYLSMICDSIIDGSLKTITEITLYCKKQGCISVLSRNWYFLNQLLSEQKSLH